MSANRAGCGGYSRTQMQPAHTVPPPDEPSPPGIPPDLPSPDDPPPVEPPEVFAA